MPSDEAQFVTALRGIASHPAARGLNDDCAVDGDLVLTHDTIVIGTHVLASGAPEDAAWKLVGTTLSDLAAKGARPVGVLLGYMLADAAWDARFVDGLRAALSQYETALLGGDTVGAPAQIGTARSFGLTAIGRASYLPVPSRGGARPGDRLWVTGSIGDAMLGYLSDSGNEAHRLANGHDAIMRYRRPAPRLAAGQALAPRVTAIMDVSDGLLLDASRMAQASGVTLHIDTGAVPQSAALRSAAALDPAIARDALRWGDDYELLFTLPADACPPVAATCIGVAQLACSDPLLVDGQPVSGRQSLGFEHQGK